VDEAAARRDGQSHSIHVDDFDAFRSPVDGSLIRNGRDLREHNLRNNVVSAQEFSPEFYAQKARERQRFYDGEHSASEKLARKQEIYNNWIRAERDGN
jgi:hypothetical protein